MSYVCQHQQSYTCTNMVEVKDTLCSECAAGECGKPGVSCSKDRDKYRFESTITTTTTTMTTASRRN
ncbi:hypothetical protein C7999DRAFT_14047 [Corynascus novoguineensis]|uniref:Uncharacterized protein n=1 Tax=Corynascus novoguineensis TaxID=1126955 RepID=A0AAN7CT89_9PEZI|nr:hypothetical protein C7999DRAFT_14047 [Corynascus novoguineensis]